MKFSHALKGIVVSSEQMKLRARFDAASRLTNLPRAVKRTGRAARGLTLFRIFYENARRLGEDREAVETRSAQPCFSEELHRAQSEAC